MGSVILIRSSQSEFRGCHVHHPYCLQFLLYVICLYLYANNNKKELKKKKRNPCFNKENDMKRQKPCAVRPTAGKRITLSTLLKGRHGVAMTALSVVC